VQEKKLLRSTTESLTRLAEAKSQVSAGVDPATAQRHMRNLSKPNSPASTMKKVGIALIAAPDPVTAVPGVALVASAYALKNKEPTTLNDLARETRKILRDIGSISL
jgi:hypothetical protein